MNLESLWDDVWTTLGLHFQHLILDYCKSVPRMDSSTVLHFQHLILTPSIYVGVWLDICVSQMARLVWIVLAYSPKVWMSHPTLAHKWVIIDLSHSWIHRQFYTSY